MIYSELVCSTQIYDDGDTGTAQSSGADLLGSAGGGGGSMTTAPAMSNLPGQSGPKISPRKYTDCFGSIPDAGSKDIVTVYVQEPLPGTSFNVGPNSVGHVAIGLTKSNGQSTITQVIGFYPDATGLSKIDAPGKLVDNGAMNYTVSISYQVIPQEFNQILNYVSVTPSTYDLFSFNCANFVYDACLAGNIKLPDPWTSVGFDAAQIMTPGALGSSISNLTGYNNVNGKGGNAPNSHGPCD